VHAHVLNDGNMAKRFFAFSILATFTMLLAGRAGMFCLDPAFATVFLAISPCGLLLAADLATATLDKAADKEAQLGDVFVNFRGLPRRLELYKAGAAALRTAMPSILSTWRANRHAGLRNNQAYALTIHM